MDTPAPDPAHPVFKLARAAAGSLARWHRATLEGLAHLPRGPALLVGNHGLYGLDTPVFFRLILEATGRSPVGLADRNVFGAGPVRRLLGRVGGVPGTPEIARRLLTEGHLVVCYPGGSREVFKGPGERERLRWERARGFARLAITTGVPVVPFAGRGVDDGWLNLGHVAAARRRFGRYAVPVAVGLGPCPLPVRFTFRLGRPLTPPRSESHLEAFRANVRAAVEALLADDADPPDRAAARVP